MSGYTNRAEELLDQLNKTDPPLPDEYYSAYREAVGTTCGVRNECLNALLELVADESTGNADNASRWKGIRTACLPASRHGLYRKLHP
jgi:hypothetical protein